MMPSEKNTKRVVLALDQAYEKFIQLEDESTDDAEIVAYRCYYTNIYESKVYVEQMQKEINRMNDLLKAQQPKKPHYTTLKYIVKGEEVSVKHPECPKCVENGLFLWDAEIEKGQAFCKRCGQAIDWREDGENDADRN